MIASLFRRAGLWHCKVKLDTWAREKRLSLNTRDKRVASVKLEQLLRDFEKEAAGMMPALSVREAAQKPLASFVDAFLRDMEARDKAPTTIKLYRGLLTRLCQQTGWVLLKDVTVSGFCEWRSDSPLKAKSLNNCLNVWSRLFRWLKRQRLTLENPFEFVDPVDGRASAREYRRALTCDEVLRLLAAAPHPRRVVYRLILETGLRRHELRSLRWGDFLLNGPADSAARHAEVNPGPTPTGRGVDRPQVQTSAVASGPCVRVPASVSKNRKTVLQPLGSEVVAELLALRPADSAPFALAFPGLIPKCPTFRKDLAAAGIPFVDALGRRVDLHALRKTHGTALVLSGAEPRVVMESMRHSDLKLTMKTYMDAAQLRGPVAAAVASLPWHQTPAKPGEVAS